VPRLSSIPYSWHKHRTWSDAAEGTNRTISWLLCSGQDAVSQAQMVDHARTLGWSFRTGENAALIAALDGREVVLPASGVKYSIGESARLVAELNPSPYVPPGRGRPGSRELAEVIHFYRVTGLPTVGVGRRWGPFVPQIRDPARDAPTHRSIDEDMQAVAEQRWDWAQPWHPDSVTAENRDEIARRRELWRPETRRGGPATKWRPCSHLAICMWASSSQQLHGNATGFIGENVIEAKDPRTVRRAISTGSKAWAPLGAWPWATREDGALGDDWSDEDEIWAALWDHVDRLARRVRRLADLIATCDPADG
jgi:hypothetical protein